MSETQPAPVQLVTLSMGAVLLLSQIFKSAWTSSPKEKIAAGRLSVKLDDLALTAPDPCVLDQRDPSYRVETLKYEKAERAWKLQTSILELTNIQFQATTSCVKFVCNKEGGADRFLAELQEQFRITD